MSIDENRGENEKKYNKLLEEYVKLYNKKEQLKKRIGTNNGRAIVVFNKI